jgi:hypothetical protein
MLTAVGIALAAGLSLPAEAFVTEVNDLFPGAGDFRMQVIHKAKDEAEWPFVAESGTLICARVLNKPGVFFVPEQKPEERGLSCSIPICSAWRWSIWE